MTDETGYARIRVLLVDDEPTYCRLLSERMTQRGMVVKSARDGAEAHAILETHAFDIILLDVQMPGMDGIEVLKSIRQRFPDTGVIVISGHADIPEALKAQKAGAVDFFFKPVDLDMLTRRIRQEVLGTDADAPESSGQP